MSRPLALLLFLGLAAPAALAQVGPPGGPPGGTVTGLVLDDATGEPLPSATVTLFASPDTTFVTGAITNAEGVFRLERLRPGAYVVRVSFVGYASQHFDAAVRPGATVDLGTVRLAASAVALDEASVEAQREFVEQRADRTVYNVADQPITAGENVLETLKTLPSVEVDAEDSISLRGGRNVAVHVNGRPVPVSGPFLAAYLRQIGADNVERIEVIPNPSARYEPDGLSGIINIVLKERAPDRGLSGGLTLGGGTRPEANLGANLAYQRGPFDVYGSYGYFYNQLGFDGSTERDYFAVPADEEQLLRLENLQDGERRFSSHFANATLDYTPARGTTLSLNGSLSARDGGGDNLQAITRAFDTGRETYTERLSDTDNDGRNATGTLAFARRFPSAGSGQADGTHELRAEVRGSANADDNDQRFSGSFEDPAAESRYVEASERAEHWAQLDYTRPLGGDARLEIGAKATREAIQNDVRFEGTPGVAADGFDYDRAIYAGYLQGAVPLGGKFEAQAGVRAEHARRAFTIDSEGTENTFDYTSLFPSAFLIYNVGPGTSVKGSYSRRINRPNPWLLSPFASPEDQTVAQQGNPNLRPEYTDAFELALQYRFFVTVTPFYRRTTDVISRRFVEVDGRTLFTPDNFAEEQSYGADLTLAAAVPGLPLRGFVSGSVFRAETDGGAVDPTISFGVTTWSARASLQAQLTPTTTAQFFGFFRGPRAILGGRASGFGFTSVGVSQKLMGDALTLSVRANDPFATARFEFASENEVYTELGIRQPRQRSVAATLTWTFGQQAQRRRPQQPQQGQPGPDDGGIGL